MSGFKFGHGPQDDPPFVAEEVERRARETARRMMATPPQPKKPAGEGGKPNVRTPMGAEEVR